MAPEADRGEAGETLASSRLVAARDLRRSLLIGLLCMCVYNANGRSISAGDAFPTRYLPFAIWRHGTVFMDPVEPLALQGRERMSDWRKGPQAGEAHWIVPTPRGRLVSLYPVTLPILIAPLYLPAVAYVHAGGWSQDRLEHAARVMEKASASLLAAASVALLFLALRRRTDERTSALLSFAYAFGTTTWVISSQALWSHGLAQLLMSSSLLVLTSTPTRPRVILAGLICGLIAANRPPDAILAAALGLYGLFWAGRRAGAFVGAAALPVALVLFYNFTAVGLAGGAYELLGKAEFLRNDMISGLAGLFFSPTRGLFVFCPFLLFLGLLGRRAPPRGPARTLSMAIAAGVAAQVLLYSMTDWRAGISFGPRFLTDLIPLLIWLLVPAVVALTGWARRLFVLSVGASIVIEAIGAFTYLGVVDAPIFAATDPASPFRAAWSFRNAPFVSGPSRGLVPWELTMRARGAIDSIEDAKGSTTGFRAGHDLVMTGWAAAGAERPLQVGVRVRGVDVGITRDFFDRPDVRVALPIANPAGFRIRFNTDGLPPGPHKLALFFWASETGDHHFVADRTLTIVSPTDSTASEANQGGDRSSVGDPAGRAASMIGARQHDSGYWLTFHTKAPFFAPAVAEMNTYLTALLVDLLDPIAEGALRESVERARRHLTAQIAGNGLVRYHGSPLGTHIGSLGCVITPDTDDTALVWRIAPHADRTRLTQALATIERYRRTDGLYRTWLAPAADYQCIDPGRDQNPADVGIQMHLLQLLLAERPSAARALCEAVRRHIHDDSFWVYYRETSIVPLIRRRELERAGCSLELDAARTRTNVSGQAIWIRAALLLSRAPANKMSAAERKEATSLLNELASADFRLVRENPPLLYHNDLTASVPRYYWSEDVGYALWLRLAHAVR